MTTQLANNIILWAVLGSGGLVVLQGLVYGARDFARILREGN